MGGPQFLCFRKESTMKRAMGERFWDMEKNLSDGVLEGGADRLSGESGSHFLRSKLASMGWCDGRLGFRVWRLEKRPPRTVGRFWEGFRWP